jgi:hypothetical protein
MKLKNVFLIDSAAHEKLKTNQTTLRLHLKTNFERNFPVNIAYDPSPIDKDVGIIYAAVVLLGII